MDFTFNQNPEESCYRFYFYPEDEKCIKLGHQCFYGIRNKFNTLEECENKCLQGKIKLTSSKLPDAFLNF